MTKKDYILIAKTIREFEPPYCDRNQNAYDDNTQKEDTRSVLAINFAVMLFAENPSKFNTEKFMRACGVVS